MKPRDELQGLTELFRNAKSVQEKNRLWEGLFPKLKKVARNRISAAGRSGQDSPTELVNDLYPALQRTLENPDNHFESRAHFFAYAAQAMRRHLAAEAKKKIADELVEENFSFESASPALAIALSDVLDRLSNRFPRAVQAFELKEYAGHSYEEILELMPEYRTKALLAADLTLIRKLLVEALQTTQVTR